MSFEGKVILITGASSGIGAACAEYFAKEGALLALVGRKPERAEQVMNKIQTLGVKVEPLFILADISTEYECIITKTIEKYGRLDVLVNNAAFLILGTMESIQIEDFDAMWATNVRGTLLLTKLAAPYLIETKGNIVNISSIASLRQIEMFLGYCMSKAALDHFTRCIALELADKGVRVNSINPGVIDTNFHDSLGFEKDGPEYVAAMESYSEMHPIKRIGQTDEVVNAIAFMASERASFITGAILLVDGGLNIQRLR